MRNFLSSTSQLFLKRRCGIGGEKGDSEESIRISVIEYLFLLSLCAFFFFAE